jgi:hypothetical protein
LRRLNRTPATLTLTTGPCCTQIFLWGMSMFGRLVGVYTSMPKNCPGGSDVGSTHVAAWVKGFTDVFDTNSSPKNGNPISRRGALLLPPILLYKLGANKQNTIRGDCLVRPMRILCQYPQVLCDGNTKYSLIYWDAQEPIHWVYYSLCAWHKSIKYKVMRNWQTH